METLKIVLKDLFLLGITIAIEYRIADKVLGVRMSKVLTFSIMFLVSFLAGKLNIRFYIATTINTNTLYYGIVTFLLYLFLFKGNAVKKMFLTVLIRSGIPISFYIFMPFVQYFIGQTSTKFLLALQILEYVNILFAFVVMEYIGMKYRNLRRELPKGYTIYLTVVLVFVQIAVCSSFDNSLHGMVSLSSAILASIFAVTGVVIVIAAVFTVDRQVDVSLREQLQTMQAESFRSRELEWRRLSGFRHDIKNHLLCLNNLLEDGKTEQAASYMRNLTDTVKQLDSPVQTGNDYADALISIKYAEALEVNIQVSLEMAIPAQGYIEPIDLCCILSNAFDNAIAACKRLAEGERWITARAFVKQGQFVIEIKNSKPSYVTVIGGEVSPKEMTADHGIGLDTVKIVLAQYGGTLNLSAADAFSFSVLLPQRLL